MLVPKIKSITAKKMVGSKTLMSLADNKTSLLWQTFMSQRNMITHCKNSYLYSVQYHAEGTDFISIDPCKLFESGAAVEVVDFENIPVTLTGFTLQGGLYAVFIHRGVATTIYQTLASIYTDWLPCSDYEIDNRPHFMVMAEDYSPTDASAEEEVWIPIKTRKSAICY